VTNAFFLSEGSFLCTKEALNIKVSTGEIVDDVSLSNLVGTIPWADIEIVGMQGYG